MELTRNIFRELAVNVYLTLFCVWKYRAPAWPSSGNQINFPIVISSVKFTAVMCVPRKKMIWAIPLKSELPYTASVIHLFPEDLMQHPTS